MSLQGQTATSAGQEWFFVVGANILRAPFCRSFGAATTLHARSTLKDQFALSSRPAHHPPNPLLILLDNSQGGVIRNFFAVKVGQFNSRFILGE